MASQPSRRRGRDVSAAVAAQRQRRAQRIRDLQDDERFDRLRTRLARRVLVVVGYAAALISGAIAWVDPDGLAAAAAPVVFLVGVGVAFLLNRVLRHVAADDDDALDERLLALRDRAFYLSYPVLVLGALAMLMVLMLGLGDAVEHRHLQAVFYTYGTAAAITPLSLLAWGDHDL